MNLKNFFKDNEEEISRKFISTENFWKRSPAGIVLLSNLKIIINKYVHGKVLDAGAGKLIYKNLIKKNSRDYESLDFKKTHSQLDHIENVEDLSFNNNTYDVIFCSQVLEHIPNPEKALKEFYRILKNGGILIVSVPHLAYLHNEPYDFYRYTKYGIEHLSKKSGFKTIEIISCGGIFSFNGYIISRLFGIFFTMPLFGKIFFNINFVISKILVFLDRVTKNNKIFPLYYIGVFKK